MLTCQCHCHRLLHRPQQHRCFAISSSRRYTGTTSSPRSSNTCCTKGYALYPKPKEENIPHHTFPLPSERNIHAVIRGIPGSTTEQEIKEELEQKGYVSHHITRLKRNGGVPLPLVVVILPKTEKSQQVFKKHELLGLSIRVEVQKNSRLIGQWHRY
nr:unnamed protein product [Callosobruchus chinensis]